MSKTTRKLKAAGAVSSTRLVRQRLDEANPVTHDLRISAMGTGITIGELKAMTKKLNIPDDAKVKFAIGQPAPGWALLESVSFCRSANEVSLW